MFRDSSFSRFLVFEIKSRKLEIPSPSFRRIGNDILALLRNTSITAFVSNERLIALGTADGSVGLFDHEVRFFCKLVVKVCLGKQNSRRLET